MKKSNLPKSQKTQKTPYKAPVSCQKCVRNGDNRVGVCFDAEGIKINLGHLVDRLKVGRKNVQAYETLAGQLSKAANLNNGHAWGWRYVASVHSGSVLPGKKFMRAVALYSAHIDPRKRQWFYFARRRAVAAIYDKSILQELIFTQMRGLGYKPITYSRYAELKRRKHA